MGNNPGRCWQGQPLCSAGLGSGLWASWRGDRLQEVPGSVQSHAQLGHKGREMEQFSPLGLLGRNFPGPSRGTGGSLMGGGGPTGSPRPQLLHWTGSPWPQLLHWT